LLRFVRYRCLAVSIYHGSTRFRAAAALHAFHFFANLACGLVTIPCLYIRNVQTLWPGPRLQIRLFVAIEFRIPDALFPCRFAVGNKEPNSPTLVCAGGVSGTNW
jgi:hypothetical protein